MSILILVVAFAAGYWLACNRDLWKRLPDWHRAPELPDDTDQAGA